MAQEKREQEMVVGGEHEHEPRWLTAQELRAWIPLIGGMQIAMAALDREIRAHCGLGFSDYRILVILSNFPEHRLRMSELAEFIFESRSRLTYQVTQLERAGLVRRDECLTDKRGALAVLTAKGQELSNRVAPYYIESIRRIFFDRLTAEQVTVLGDALYAVFAGLKDEAVMDGIIQREVNRGKDIEINQ